MDDRSQSARQIQQLESNLGQLKFLHETSQLLTATLDLDDVLRSLMSQVRDYFQVEAVSVALLDEESGELIFRVAVGEASERVTGLRLPAGEGIAGWVARTGETVIIDDAYNDTRFYPGVDERTNFHTQKVLAVPIKTDYRTIGVIEAMNPISGTFDKKAPRLLTQIAHQAAAAIRNAALYRRARQAERRYESLFHTSPAPTIVMDLDGQIVDLNQRASAMLGRPSEELIGTPWSALLADSGPDVEAAFRDVRQKQYVRTEMKVATEGTPRVYEVHMTTIDYGGREVIQWIGHDVTEQLELERMRDDLMHMIVHDLRNPLGNVISSLHMMRTALVEKDEVLPLLEVLRVAMRSSEKLRRLIDSLLDMRKLEEGKAELNRELVQADLLVQEAVELILPVIEKKEQELVLDIPSDLPPLYVDRDMVSRVLTNILDNAAKFTPPQGAIFVSAARERGELLFAVSDTGPGIEPELYDRVFERFTRLENAKGTRGTGLGLPFCKLAVEAHGGSIWVDSAPGRGSSFKFRLPVES